MLTANATDGSTLGGSLFVCLRSMNSLRSMMLIVNRTHRMRCLLSVVLFTLPTVLHVEANSMVTSSDLPPFGPSFGFLRDTLYVMDSMFLEVRLDQQTIYQRFRSGRVERYLCSTGNPAIQDGIATREGIFTVQWKSKRHFSKQFEVYLNYWMPFNGGIGFHGLDGRSYYRFLGRRRSSHGCVRISNETGAKMFPTTPSGTIVYVHSGTPARVLLFADTTRQPEVIVLNNVNSPLLQQRLDAVLGLRWQDTALWQPLALPPRTKFTATVGVGVAAPKIITQFQLPVFRLPVPPPSPATEQRPFVTSLRLIPTRSGYIADRFDEEEDGESLSLSR